MACRFVITSTFIIASGLALADATDFLRASSGVNESRGAIVFSNLAASLGHSELERIQKVIRSTYASLSKDAQGNLDRGGVSYALHRYFVHQHGWYVKGLQPSDGPWGSLSPDYLIKDRVPAHIYGLFSQRLARHGLSLQELAVFAGTLESVVREEGVQKLEATYESMRAATTDRLSSAHADIVVRAYMMPFLTGGVLRDITPGKYYGSENLTREVYPSWPQIKVWLQDVRMGFEHDSHHRRNAFVKDMSFDDVAQVVRLIGDQFGRYQALECHDMKNVLVEREYQGSGRIRLADFYVRTHVKYDFSESVDYLRQLGALDETDPQSVSVLIPNYINSMSNCIAPSGFYAVCCRDECEGLLTHLEDKIAAPEAAPGFLAGLVASLESDTVEAPRNLSTSLLRRLQEIAEYHGGRVPIHGRLFSQWMHHAYPRECSFPHVSGTTAPVDLVEFIKIGNDPSVSEDYLMKLREEVSGRGDELNLTVADIEAMLPWTAVEELVVQRSASSPVMALLLKSAMVVTVLALAVSTAARKLGAFALPSTKEDRHFV